MSKSPAPRRPDATQQKVMIYKTPKPGVQKVEGEEKAGNALAIPLVHERVLPTTPTGGVGHQRPHENTPRQHGYRPLSPSISTSV